jgi:hypothetical protein
MLAMRHFFAVAVASKERLLRVDGGPSFIMRRSAAVGGEPTFAQAMANGEVAPTAAVTLIRWGKGAALTTRYLRAMVDAGPSASTCTNRRYKTAGQETSRWENSAAR